MRPLLLLILTGALLNAAIVEVQYAVSYWILGRIGTTHLRFESENGRYRIEAEAALEGVAALVARHHREHHTSTGHIAADGTLIPERYEVVKTLDDYKRHQQYYFDRRHGRILLRQQETFNETTRRFNVATMRFDTDTTTQERAFYHVEAYRADNDLLTLYFNARKPLKTLGNTPLNLKAVGAKDGRVTVEKEGNGQHFVVLLDQDIFRSREGRMHVKTDDRFYVTEAVLKDVLLFGDLEVKREWLKQSP